jgi:putative endonuclease
MDRGYHVYILASKANGTLYVGVTNDLSRRVFEHRERALSGFTSKYGVTKLVWFDAFDTMDAAIQQEKRIKRWRRDWKIQLIEKANPAWRDLYESQLL